MSRAEKRPLPGQGWRYAEPRFGRLLCAPVARARWATELQKYGLRVLQWIDSAEGLEKQCAILLLPRGCPGDERPVLVVAFRGSKSAKDYARTDVSPFLVPTPWATRASTPGRSLDAEEDNDADVDDKAARLMPLLAKSDLPCTTLGLWRAYAGTSSRCRLGLGPRGRVRRAVESALVLHPSARLCVTGHSLGGSLAILCALDLLLTSPMVYSANLTLVAFAAPRFFNAATQKSRADCMPTAGSTRFASRARATCSARCLQKLWAVYRGAATACAPPGGTASNARAIRGLRLGAIVVARAVGS